MPVFTEAFVGRRRLASQANLQRKEPSPLLDSHQLTGNLSTENHLSDTPFSRRRRGQEVKASGREPDGRLTSAMLRRSDIWRQV
jgi:hypothetical protein